MRHERSSTARRATTSRQENGASTPTTMIQRQYASAIGDIASATARPMTMLPAQNSEVSASRVAGEVRSRMEGRIGNAGSRVGFYSAGAVILSNTLYRYN